MQLNGRQHEEREIARKQQLVAVMQEAVATLDSLDLGRNGVPAPPAAPGTPEQHHLPEDAVRTWTEDELLKHFGRCITSRIEGHAPVASNAISQAAKPQPQLAPAPAGAPQGNILTGAPAPGRGDPPFPPPGAEVLARWFPSLSRWPVQQPRLRVFCFHSAGCAEDMFSSEGTGARRAPSPLIDWCKQYDAELLAVQAPGRGSRSREPPCTSAQQLAAQLLPVLGSRLREAGSCSCTGAGAVAYVIVSHSVGCWLAYELLLLARSRGLPMPSAWFLSAMPSPDIPEPERPWRQQRTLGEEQFKEECRGWDINEVVFTPAMWPTYQPLLRADFSLFDQYQPTVLPATAPQQGPGGAAADGGAAAQAGAGSEGQGGVFEFPVHAFWGQQDRRVTQRMVERWHLFTSGPFTCSAVAGNHLWPLQKEAKAVWLQQVVDRLARLLPPPQ